MCDFACVVQFNAAVPEARTPHHTRPQPISHPGFNSTRTPASPADPVFAERNALEVPVAAGDPMKRPDHNREFRTRERDDRPCAQPCACCRHHHRGHRKQPNPYRPTACTQGAVRSPIQQNFFVFKRFDWHWGIRTRSETRHYKSAILAQRTKSWQGNDLGRPIGACYRPARRNLGGSAASRRECGSVPRPRRPDRWFGSVRCKRGETGCQRGRESAEHMRDSGP